MPKRHLIGIITSTKMAKTVVVKVESVKEHPKYKRRYRVHKKYKAHVESNDYLVGDKVTIEECQPMSRDKKWKVIKKNESAAIIEEEAEVEEKQEENL